MKLTTVALGTDSFYFMNWNWGCEIEASTETLRKFGCPIHKACSERSTMANLHKTWGYNYEVTREEGNRFYRYLLSKGFQVTNIRRPEQG